MTFGGIEAGGTKFVCALASASGDILREIRIPTGAPAETMRRAAEFFRSGETPAAMGIGSFGPVQLDRAAADYGSITSTPKREWRGCNIVAAVREWFPGPVAFDTDVNAAALGEHRWGAARGLRTFIYVTVGTGIGGGAMVEGALLHGESHPEMGHIRVPHDRARDPFEGSCPYHGDCLEGLASGVALEQRTYLSASTIPDDHPVWELEAEYLALACANWAFSFSPQRIILAGGVIRPRLMTMIRARAADLIGGYAKTPEIVEPGLGNRSGVLGAIALAEEVA